jgi:hypothetical protein
VCLGSQARGRELRKIAQKFAGKNASQFVLLRRQHAGMSTRDFVALPATQELLTDKTAANEIAGKLFLLTSFFIEPDVLPWQESLRKLTPMGATGTSWASQPNSSRRGRGVFRKYWPI